VRVVHKLITSFRLLFFLTLVCLFLTAFGCTGNERLVAHTDKNGTFQPPKRSDYLNDLLMKAASLQKTDPNSDYVLGPEDVLEIEVYQADEFKRTVRVNGQGFVTLPLVGQVKAKGLNTTQLEKELEQRLAKYLQDPQVSIYIKEYKSQRIGVMGAVAHPQIYNVTGQKYLLDMLFMAGMTTPGLNGTGGAGNVCYIFRPAQSQIDGPTQTETIAIDMIELLEKGNRILNIPVFGGDIINVPKAGTVFVDGAVARPGAFGLASGAGLVQAIAMAGGLRFEADRTEIQILRMTGNGERQIIVADYDTAKTDERYMLRDGDIVLVPRNGMKTFAKAFFLIFRGGVTFGDTTEQTLSVGQPWAVVEPTP
jgi:polysaccharide export outer membrane protein